MPSRKAEGLRHHKADKSELLSSCVSELLSVLESKGTLTPKEIHSIKLSHSGLGMLKNTELISAARELFPEKAEVLVGFLRIHRSRTVSGVVPVAVMTVSDCPHGACIYCPKGDNSAQSYTGEEPAALRGRQNGFDPYKQVQNRLSHYSAMGYKPEKCELIVMGGTFLAMGKDYIEWFMQGAYDGFNGTLSGSLATALSRNESSRSRVIGTTFETRPDYCKQAHVDLMLSLGGTRVELGVQCLDDEIYKKVNRGHTVADVVEATSIARNAGFKLCYHMMPGLFADFQKDLSYFKRLFSDPAFRPDMLKIYPTMVLEGTGLYNLWKKGEYVPYDTEAAAELVKEIKKIVPSYVRIMRVQRDIPSKLIAAGVANSNLRELALKKLAAEGQKCNCIRCREHGVRLLRNQNPSADFKLKQFSYSASDSEEHFLSYESADGSLAGFLRARDITSTHRKELEGSLAVRELHVYGSQVPLGLDSSGQEIQHKGFGSSLLSRAEEIAVELGKSRVAVISGIGARQYYRRLGYSLQGPYMVKTL